MNMKYSINITLFFALTSISSLAMENTEPSGLNITQVASREEFIERLTDTILKTCFELGVNFSREKSAEQDLSNSYFDNLIKIGNLILRSPMRDFLQTLPDEQLSDLMNCYSNPQYAALMYKIMSFPYEFDTIKYKEMALLNIPSEIPDDSFGAVSLSYESLIPHDIVCLFDQNIRTLLPEGVKIINHLGANYQNLTDATAAIVEQYMPVIDAQMAEIKTEELLGEFVKVLNLNPDENK